MDGRAAPNLFQKSVKNASSTIFSFFREYHLSRKLDEYA